jgi:tRNA(Ile)-lysidine synthase
MLTEIVRATIGRHSLISPGEGVVVGVSGGPDSVALLHVLHELSDDLEIWLHAAHLNHGLRGAEAEEDSEYVLRLADSLGLAATLEKRDVAEMAHASGMSLEQAARAARYEFLEKVADVCGASKIAVGHTSDDQAETVLLNLLRGAGPEGLAGMASARGRIIRPLLDATRQEVEDYCAGKGLAPRFDSSNLSRDFARNRIRLDLMPFLERDNPALRRHLLRLADIAREENAFLRDIALRELRRLSVKGEAEEPALSGPRPEIVISARRLIRRPVALQRRILREALRLILHDLLFIEHSHIEALRTLAVGKGAREIHLPRGLRAWLRGGQLFISAPPRRVEKPIQMEWARPDLSRAPSRELAEWVLSIPGLTPLPELGLEIEATLIPASNATIPEPDANVAWLDYSRISEPLTARTWRRGDRFRPLGAPGSTKLQDFFVNAKVPREQRGRIPIVLSGQTIAWVVGYRLAEDFKLMPGARVALRMRAVSWGV